MTSESPEIALHCQFQPLGWNDGWGLLKRMLLFAAASVIVSTMLRFVLMSLLLWRKMPEIRGEVGEQEIHIKWSSLLVDTSGKSFHWFVDHAWSALIWAPILETFIFVLLWMLLRIIRVGQKGYVLVAAVVFGFYHIILEGGDIRVLLTGVGGAFLAAIYVIDWHRYGPAAAYFACAGCHMVMNLLIGGLGLVGMKLSS